MTAATLNRFVAQLLAPLPPEAEQVEDKAFQKELLADAKKIWSCGMRYVNAAAADRQLHWLRHLIAQDEGRDAASEEMAARHAERRHYDACDRQMRIPAPSIGALRWKEDTRQYDGGRPEWEDAIAADKARLEAKQ